MEQRDLKRKLLDEHLRYEVDMFDEAAKFLMSEQFAKLDRENTNNRDDWFRANAAIETFWTHARTLREFFTQKKNDEPVKDAHHASARDFAPDYWHEIDLDKDIADKINAQVSHLNYGRKSEPSEKLGPEMQRVKAAIDKEVRRFQDKLAAVKKEHRDRAWGMAPRQVVTYVPALENNVSTTSATFMSTGVLSPGGGSGSR